MNKEFKETPEKEKASTVVSYDTYIHVRNDSNTFQSILQVCLYFKVLSNNLNL